MAFDFPGTPSNGASYTANGITYTFDGTVWKRETGAVKGQKGEVGAAGTLATAVVKKVRTATLSGTVYYTSVGSGNWTNACEIPSFTPNSANSVFLVNINIGEFSRYSGSGAATGEMRIRDANGNGSIDSIETFRDTANFTNNTATGLSFSLIDLRGGTSNRNYQVQLNDGNNNGVPQVKNIRMMCIELDTTV
jgi:hypothetical protein